MNLRTSVRRRRAALVALAAGPLLVAMGCSSDDERGSATSTTTTTAPASARPSDAGGDPALVGAWAADAGSFLAGFFDAQGVEEPVTCEGETVLEFSVDGAFTAAVTGSCTFAEGDGEVDIEATGWYVASGGRLELVGVDARSELVGDDGQRYDLAADTFDDADTTYGVEGDRLTIGDLAVDAGLIYQRR